MEKGSNNPLVTIAVVAYNSAPYIIETLESIKAQTYQNIELIVSDDCSKDNTVEICEKWIDKNSSRFVNAKVLTTPKNTGTSGNANRALQAATGKWFKIIAGDDLFLPNAVETYVNYMEEDSSKVACFAEAIHFKGKLEDKRFTYEPIDLEQTVLSESISAKRQFNILKKIYFGSGPTFFCLRKAIFEVGGFDERFPLQEDYPLFIKLTRNNYKLHLMHAYTVFKRVEEQSVSHASNTDSFYTNIKIKCIKEWGYRYKYEQEGFLWRQFLKFSNYLHMNVIKNGNSRTSLKCRLYYYLQRIIDPYVLYDRGLHLYDRLMH